MQCFWTDGTARSDVRSRSFSHCELLFQGSKKLKVKWSVEALAIEVVSVMLETGEVER